MSFQESGKKSKKMQVINLTNKKSIGEVSPCFIIAEAGVNHNGSLDLALRLVDIAAESGADAIKFQTFNTENLILKTAPKAKYHIETTGSDVSQSWFDLLKSQELTRDMHLQIQEYCNARGIIFLSTPYDEESVDLLIELDVPIIKIASTDANNIKFLEYVASKGRPIILSTGMATIDEIRASILSIKNAGVLDIVLLQCTGNYPCPATDANLLAIKSLKKEFNLITGYSDHVNGFNAGIASIALGAKVYEKHFTLDRSLPGPDHRASVEPAELKLLIEGIRQTELMLGNGEKRVMKSEEANREILRKRLVAARDIEPGCIVASKDIRIVRAGASGVPAGDYYQILGKKLVAPLMQNQPFKYENFE